MINEIHTHAHVCISHTHAMGEYVKLRALFNGKPSGIWRHLVDIPLP